MGRVSWRSWLIPAGVSDWAGRRSGYLTTFDDTVGSWEAAQGQSSGYDSSAILKRVHESTEKVLRDEAAFERDGIAFTVPEYRWPVLAGLLDVAARDGELRVLDFGGSLGSVYWQHRDFFTGLKVTWGVVEQPGFVVAGKALGQESVEFFPSVPECLSHVSPNVVLLSSVLQYLSDPERILNELKATPADTILVDRTPMSDFGTNIACVQVVPKHIYPGNYPAWIFSRQWLREQFSNWDIVSEFEGIEPPGRTKKGVDFTWDGLIARRETRD